MTENLLKNTWTELDSHELRILLDGRIGGPGQYDGRAENPNKLYLPLAGASSRIGLVFSDNKIVGITPGPAFDADEWTRIGEEIETSILAGPPKVGREYSFSTFRVRGSWRGDRSGVQILPPPGHAPTAPVEMADHPFILEFPIKACNYSPVTNHRRMREHRRLTLVLNILLIGHTSLQPRRPEHFWAAIFGEEGAPKIRWVQQFYFAKLGGSVIDELSPIHGDKIQQIEPEEYYSKVGHDGKCLRVPTDLDESICRYFQLSPSNRAKFDRAAFWFDMGRRQWNISVSASFTALISSIEALTERGNVHQFNCPVCREPTQHETPGATQRFRDFLETYAPGAALTKRRNEMYSLRSGILHGSDLMQLDQDRAFGWDPPWWNERELHDELWRLTRIALLNWLKNPPIDNQVRLI